MNQIRKAANVVNDNSRERGELSDQVAAQIRAERAAAGFTRNQMVERSGVPLSTYRKLETGQRVADVMQLARICDAVDLPITEFWLRVMQRLEASGRGKDDAAS